MKPLPDGGAVTETVIDVEAWPDLTAAEADVLEDQQVPYENFADDEELAGRALQLYLDAKTTWENDTANIRDNWLWIDYLFRANSLRKNSNRDVHVPELLKAHRALVPRIVEAFFGNGQSFFAAKGRDRMDRMRDTALTAQLSFQLDQNRFRTLMAPFVSSICKYQVGCWKVTWEVKKERIPYHWIETVVKDGKTVEVHKRQWRDVCTFVGNRIRLVDPARLILDAQRWDLQDLAYIGDIRDTPLHEIIDDDRYKNRDKLLERTSTDAQNNIRARQSSAARSGLKNSTAEDSKTPKGTSQFGELGELWCWFNWAPMGQPADMRKTVITVYGNSVVLRLQENFHDDKHLPYAVARYSDNGFEFFDVGLYDPALRVQDEIDHFRGTLYEAADLTIGPRAFTKGPAVDLPNSMFDMPPGWIGKDVGEIAFAPVPNTFGAAPFMDSIMRRDMEEITGVTRLWQGSESGAGGDSTATEVRRKIEESNRRLLGLIRSVDDGMTSLLMIMHANNQQFMTDKTKFRVLNTRWAKLLGTNEYTMSPSELLGPVDFTFYGVTRIQAYGLRGTNLLTFLQVMGPMIQENPQMFNMAELTKQVYQAVVGEDSEDEILRDPQDFDSMSDQRLENRKLVVGQRVPVHPLDDDDAHLAIMEEDGIRAFVEDENNPEPARKAAFEHYKGHHEQKMRKAAQQKAMEKQAAMQALAKGPAAQEAPPAGGLERGTRKTNGDGTNQQVAKSGRQGPITDANNGS